MQEKRMPIDTTILNGFLGAGKTTLMQSLLVQARDLNNVTLGVIVNEMSTLDVDGSVLDTSEVISRRSPHFASIPGKVSAVKRGSASFARRSKKFSRMERSRTLSLKPLAVPTLGRCWKPSAHCLSCACTDFCLSWTPWFYDRTMISGGRSTRWPAKTWRLAKRGVANLLAEQVMFANRLLLSKADKVSRDVLQQVAEAVHPLNPRADVLAMQWGNVSLEKVLAMPLYDFERVKAFGKELTEWEAEHSAAPIAQPETYKIGNRVLRDPRPFHPQRLYNVYTQALGIGIYRSKGFFWLPTRDNLMLLWNQTGGSVGLEIVNYWRISALEDGSLNLSDWERDAMRAKLTEAHPDFGDRRCQLTVIGDELELDKFVEALQTCFCTDDEIAAWQAGEDFADPWPKSVATLRAK
ncbi:GTP-binding protein [Yoonia sp. GPGPB17]|uniref:GTP-binding protein n=1 Tax=Yoonia sp. GPGPB17 TaxID=3026147 RepID=UPI0030C3FEA8